MSPRTESKISYEKHAIDSGYLSDLAASARKNHEAAGRSIVSVSSSSSGCTSELIMNKLDNTEWDEPVTGAKLAALDRQCRDLASQIKKPTRFPIVPLDSTLARARAQIKTRKDRAHLPKSAGSDRIAKTPPSKEVATVVDRYGRTRAAWKRIAVLMDEAA